MEIRLDDADSDSSIAMRRCDSIQRQYEALDSQQAQAGPATRMPGTAPYVSARLQPGSRRHRKAFAKTASLVSDAAIAPAASSATSIKAQHTAVHGDTDELHAEQLGQRKGAIGNSSTDAPVDTGNYDTPDTSAGAYDPCFLQEATQGLYVSFQDILALQRFMPVALPQTHGHPPRHTLQVDPTARMVGLDDKLRGLEDELAVFSDEQRSEAHAQRQMREELAVEVSEVTALHARLRGLDDELAVFGVERQSEAHAQRQMRDELAGEEAQLESEAALVVSLRGEHVQQESTLRRHMESQHELEAALVVSLRGELAQQASTLRRQEALTMVNQRKFELVEQNSVVQAAQHSERLSAAQRLWQLELEASQAKATISSAT